jgi:serine/threonine-protein kinase RsbW
VSLPSPPEAAVVSLSIPCRAEYVGVARLAILGVASRLNFSYDEVEDLRLAVGEACTSAIDRSGGESSRTDIRIYCDIQPDALTISVNYKANGEAGRPAVEPEPAVDTENIGALLMEILVDSVEVQEDAEEGTTVRLNKKVRVQ